MRRFFLLQPRFPATLPPGATRFSPTVMTQGWLVVVQVSRPRTRVAGGKIKRRGVLIKTSRRPALRIQASRRRRKVNEEQINTQRTRVMSEQTGKSKHLEEKITT